MKKLIITGGSELEGTIRISGAKNSAVALIPAAILANGSVTICNVPEITDTDALCEILEYLGAKINFASESLVIDPKAIVNKEIPEEKSRKLRASYYFLGAMLGKFRHAEMYFPGGCSIGERPINLHLKGFEALGATVHIEKNKYVVEADELKGAPIYLDVASVGATINIMLASVYAYGETVIDNAAKEPEIVNVATFLNNMGAKITGAGTSTIHIQGVRNLDGCFTEVIPDRIEAGTYLLAGALCGNRLRIENIIPKHIESLTSKLREMGVPLEFEYDSVFVSRVDKMRPTNIETAVYPGFPTDLQQLFMVLLTYAEGTSQIEENIFENRFMQVPYLNRMGANISLSGDKATIYGPTKLAGCSVVATDLRAGAAMVLAALSADGVTEIHDVQHILRGYENIVQKLKDVGAKIQLVDDSVEEEGVF